MHRYPTFQSTPPARGATTNLSLAVYALIFQSTPPARGATSCGAELYRKRTGISIHAPREGGDYDAQRPFPQGGDFNPRPPRGGRLLW